MEHIEFKTEYFEGPLDLLLHLISRNKMKLYDIRILELIDQYLETVGGIGPDELESASEFIEMAARLVYMKSVALLPRSEESEKLERELTGQLIEYSLCKQAARKLASRAQGIYHFVRPPQKMVEVPEKEYDVRRDPAELVAAYLAMSIKSARRRPPDMKKLAQTVAPVRVPVASRIIYILKGLRTRTINSVDEMFTCTHSISEAVATFLALLELIKGGRVAISEDGDARILEKERTRGGH